MVHVAKAAGFSGLAIAAGLLLSAGKGHAGAEQQSGVYRSTQSPPLRKTYSRFSSAPVSSATGQARTPPCH